MTHRLLVSLLAVAMTAVTCCVSSALGAEDGDAPPSAAPHIRAAIIYRICKFVDWPEVPSVTDSTPPFVFGLVGDGGDAEEAVLTTLMGKMLHDRPVSVIDVTELDDVASCQVLLVLQSKEDRLLEVIEAAREQPVLTISELDGFAERGGILELFQRDRRIAFRINLDVAQRSGLKFSSQLLKMADVMQTVVD